VLKPQHTAVSKTSRLLLLYLVFLYSKTRNLAITDRWRSASYSISSLSDQIRQYRK